MSFKAKSKMAATMACTPADFCLIYLLIVVSFSSAARLNVPKVLLPYYSSVASNFTLEVKPSDRCYTWTSSRPDVATISPVSPDSAGCATQAVVTAVSKTSNKMTSIVLAEDHVTGQVLRCDIIVDAINSIEIETTTRELYLEDSPEEFEVTGKDSEGNTFSVMDGIAFEWSLISDTDVDQDTIVDAHNILRIISFSESSYKTPPHIERMEKQGLQGSHILVNGIRTGTAKVAVKMKDPAYKNVKPYVVRLIVIANIMLNPGIVYILTGAQVTYLVQLIGQTTTSEIPMPSDQYYLQVEEEKICGLDAKTSTVTALARGTTNIVLKDKNIKIKEAFRQPSAGIHVVAPGYLGFQVLPGRKWVLEVSRVYEIYIEIYDKDSHKIFPSENIRVLATFPKKYFNVQYSSPNGTYHIVDTLYQGHTQLTGILRGVMDGDKLLEITPVIKNLQDVEIYDPIKVIPPLLVFPWDPVSKQQYTYPLRATGGSGNYTWTSTKSEVATVNVKGEIATKDIGTSEVTASDMKNTDIKGSMIVRVVPPVELMFLPSVVEAEITTHLDLPLAAYAYLKNPGKHQLADCTLLPFQVSLKDEKVFEYIKVLPPSVEGSCATIRVKALQLGNTEVHIVYQTKKLRLDASVTIAAHLPLRTIDPENVAVVTVGSSKELVLEGGPRPWVLDPARYFQDLGIEDKNVVRTTHNPSFGLHNNLHLFRVLCIQLGEQVFTVSVGNQPTSKNKFPVTASAKIRFACAKPVSLHLQPVINYPVELPPCPISLDSNQPIPVHSYENLEILVVVTDSNGRKFDNFTSLAFDWLVSNTNVAGLEDDGIATETTTLQTGRKLVKSYQTLLLQGKTASLTVTATINKYQRRYFTTQQINFPEEISPRISKSLVLLLVDDAILDPSVVHIFNHPSSKFNMDVRHGSGFFHLEHGGAKVAKTKYNEKTRKIQVLPVDEGHMSVVVHDLCLASDKPATAHIHISGVDSINLRVLDKVEIRKEIVASVQVLDKTGNPLLAKYFQLMNLTPHTGSDIITVRPYEGKETDAYTAVFIVHGMSLGTTTLTFTATSKDDGLSQMTSQPKDIQVFPPLRLNPRNITLIIGALFQVTSYGGPQPQSTVEYSIADVDIASISSSGLIEALKLGDTKVVGKAIGYDPETGKNEVYSQDEVTVYVVILTGIRIHAPLTRLQAGNRMPVYAMGTNEHVTPFAFGSAIPPLTLTWSINNKEVADLKNVYYMSGITVPRASNFAMRLHTKREGHVSIRLTAVVHPDSRLQIANNVKLTDEVQIQVFEKLTLVSPDVCDGQLIITPNTDTVVKTNRDSTARMRYRILEQHTNGRSQTVIKVHEGGHLSSGSYSGQATLEIMSLEDFGVNQTMVVLVKVKPVSYMMLNVDTVIRTSGTKLAVIPVGTVLHLSVSYHDDVGAMFHRTNTRLKYRPNRFDLLQVSSGKDNGTLVARATEPGQTVLKVWDAANPIISDFINVEVGYAITPSKESVTVGDIVCFTSPLISSEGHPGHWRSTGDIVHIDRDTGIAVAGGVGRGLIMYNVSSTVLTYTELQVSPITRVTLQSSGIKYLSNLPSRSGVYDIPVMLHDGSSATSNVRGNNCSEILADNKYHVGVPPFVCEVSMSRNNADITPYDLFRPSAVFDAKTGKYLCRLAQQTNRDIGQQVSTLETVIRVRAVVPQKDQQGQVTSMPLEFDFFPSFYPYTNELLLSNLLSLASVRISATGRIKDDIKINCCWLLQEESLAHFKSRKALAVPTFRVISSDPSVIEVLAPEHDSQSEHIIHYPVRLLVRSGQSCPVDRQDLFIEVVSPLTSQKHTIPVKLKVVGQPTGPQSVPTPPRIEHAHEKKGWIILLADLIEDYIGIIIAIIVIAIVFALFQFRGKRESYSSASPQHFAPQTPGPGTPVYFTNTPPGYGMHTSPHSRHLWSSPPEYPDRSMTFEKRTPNRSPTFQ